MNDSNSNPAGAIALCCSHVEGTTWESQLRAALPKASLTVWPAVAAEAECAIVWSPTQAFMDAHPRLRLIFNMGAGVDALMRLRLPTHARVVRIEDGGMAVQMADYVCHAVLRHFREFDAYADEAAAHNWRPRKPRSRADFPVGVMGLGALGLRVTETLVKFDFPVLGWSQTIKHVEGVTCLAGADAFDEFLSRTRILVCMLPLTPLTRDIVCGTTLSRLLPGAYFINVARGAHVVESDLLALIRSGHLAGATLDVTREEPLPPGHPFWTCPQIVLTPHIAGQTVIDEAIAQIASKINAGLGDPRLSGLVDLERGY